MRPLLLAALLTVPASAELDPEALKDRFLTNEDPSTRLAERDFPFALRGAFESVQSVQLGCEQPCASEAERALYEQKIRLAGGALRLTDPQKEAAVRNYMRRGAPRLRSTVARKDSPAFNQAAASRLDPRLQAQLPKTIARMTAALGGLLGPGDINSGAGVAAGRLGTLPETDRQVELTRPGYQLPSALAMAGLAPPPLARARPQRLSVTMYERFRGHFAGQPEMQAALRHILSESERMVRRGFQGGGSVFSDRYAGTNDWGRVLIAAQSYTMDFRAGYGSADAGATDGGFEAASNVRLTAEQIAALDHFFFAAHTGALPVVGTTLCAGGVLAWDALKPLVTSGVPFTERWNRSVSYNMDQVAVGLKGCAASTTVVSTALGI